MRTRTDDQHTESSNVLEAEKPSTHLVEDKISEIRQRGPSKRAGKINCEICNKKFDSQFFFLKHQQTAHKYGKEV